VTFEKLSPTGKSGHAALCGSRRVVGYLPACLLASDIGLHAADQTSLTFFLGNQPLGVLLKFQWFALLLFVGRLLVACVDGDAGEGEGDAGEGEGEGEDLVTPLVNASRTAARDCDLPQLRVFKLEPSALLQVEQDLRDDFANPTRQLNRENYDACLASFAVCEINQVCATLFRGTRVLGEGCATRDDCDDGLACPGDADQCRSCVPGGLDAGCTDNDGCAVGFVCFDDLCAPPTREGDPCTTLREFCAPGLVCRVVSDDVIQGTCLPPLDVGDACVVSCGELGLACVNGICEELTVVQPGELCDVSGADIRQYCVDQIVGDNNCIDADADGVGVCVVGAAVGAACAATGCLSDATCEEDVCVAKPGVGDACPLDFGCKSDLSCVDKVCTEPVNLVCAK
jgi:hypothetical protein